MFGGIALLFFMTLIILSIVGYRVPQDSRYLVVIVLAFSGALSAAFLGGNATARGQIKVPYLEDPLTVAVTGGVATLVILLILGIALLH